jgi:hypothetical protein
VDQSLRCGCGVGDRGIHVHPLSVWPGSPGTDPTNRPAPSRCSATAPRPERIPRRNHTFGVPRGSGMSSSEPMSIITDAVTGWAIVRAGRGARWGGGAVPKDGELLREGRSESPLFERGRAARAAVARTWRTGRVASGPRARSPVARVVSRAGERFKRRDDAKSAQLQERGFTTSAVRRGPAPGRRCGGFWVLQPPVDHHSLLRLGSGRCLVADRDAGRPWDDFAELDELSIEGRIEGRGKRELDGP